MATEADSGVSRGSDRVVTGYGDAVERVDGDGDPGDGRRLGRCQRGDRLELLGSARPADPGHPFGEGEGVALDLVEVSRLAPRR